VVTDSVRRIFQVAHLMSLASAHPTALKVIWIWEIHIPMATPWICSPNSITSCAVRLAPLVDFSAYQTTFIELLLQISHGAKRRHYHHGPPPTTFHEDTMGCRCHPSRKEVGRQQAALRRCKLIQRKGSHMKEGSSCSDRLISASYIQSIKE